MAIEDARSFERRPCRGNVTVTKLTGGPYLNGSLVNLSSAGAKLFIDHPLAVGEMIRLIFPRRPGEVSHAGRIMIGQVLYCGAIAGRHTIGIAFGWHAGVDRGPLPHSRKNRFWSWLRISCGKRNPVERKASYRPHPAILRRISQ